MTRTSSIWSTRGFEPSAASPASPSLRFPQRLPIPSHHGLLVEELCLRNNLLSTIEGLEPLVSLKQLDLYENQIEKIQGLASLTQLE